MKTLSDLGLCRCFICFLALGIAGKDFGGAGKYAKIFQAIG